MTAPRIGILGVLPTVQQSLWRTQIPIPIPLPPPIWPSQPQRPQSPPVIGDPDAWWNDDIRNLPSRVQDWWKSQTDEDYQKQCDDALDNDLLMCKMAAAMKGLKGSEEYQKCERVAIQRYGECLKHKGPDKIRTPRYPPGW